MQSRKILAVGLALLALLLAIPTTSAQPMTNPWEGITLQTRGWTTLSYGGPESAVFYKRVPTKLKRGLPRAWSRYEFLIPQSSGVSEPPTLKSYVELREYDCAQDRQRILQQIIYEGQNLEGKSHSTSGDQTWDYPAPGTNGEKLQNIACGSR